MNTLGGKELESVMIGSRGVVGSPMGNTKMEQNGYSSITDQRCIQLVLVGSYNPILIKVERDMSQNQSLEEVEGW